MPSRKLPDVAKARARALRKDASEAESRLWYNLRRHGLEGYKFRRQHPIGPYVADFYCAAGRLVVELDGGQHLEPEQVARDRVRTRYLEAQGLEVLRFSNLDVLRDTETVLDVILRALRPSA